MEAQQHKQHWKPRDCKEKGPPCPRKNPRWKKNHPCQKRRQKQRPRSEFDTVAWVLPVTMEWAVNCVQSHTIQIYIMHNKTMVGQAMEITPTIPTVVVVQYHRCVIFHPILKRVQQQTMNKRWEHAPGSELFFWFQFQQCAMFCSRARSTCRAAADSRVERESSASRNVIRIGEGLLYLELKIKNI